MTLKTLRSTGIELRKITKDKLHPWVSLSLCVCVCMWKKLQRFCVAIAYSFPSKTQFHLEFNICSRTRLKCLSKLNIRLVGWQFTAFDFDHVSIPQKNDDKIAFCAEHFY